MIREYDNCTLAKNTRIIKAIADNLSNQNRGEVRLLFGEDASPFIVLKEQAEATESGFVLFDDDGRPHGIGGVMKNRTVWFVLSENHTRAMRVSWLKGGFRWFSKQLEKYHNIHGYCWEKNELSIRWMKWMGFDFAAPDSEATATIANEKFLYFQKTA